MCSAGQKESKRECLCNFQFVCACVCVKTQRSQTVILKHKQHKDQQEKKSFHILYRRQNDCDIIANIRYIAQP